MVQTIKTITLKPHNVIVIFESVRILKRCFFGIYALDFTPSIIDYLDISFVDSVFTQRFTLSPICKRFESSGKNIFQGNILIRNTSNENTHDICATEILE